MTNQTALLKSIYVVFIVRQDFALIVFHERQPPGFVNLLIKREWILGLF